MASIYRGSENEELALDLKRRYNLDVFIETGTFQGDTTIWAAEAGFSEIHTIESEESAWGGLAERFRGYPAITFWGGTTENLLPMVLKDVKKPALIFLDAHSVTNMEADSPILDEISAIWNRSTLKHIIMIDDASRFGTGGWPSLRLVMNAVAKTGRLCWVKYDVIIGEWRAR